MANIITGCRIAVIKVANVISGFARRKQFVAVHSMMNKVTGLVLFILPLTLQFVDLTYSAVVACGIATFAAVQEGYILTTKSVRIRTLLMLENEVEYHAREKEYHQ